MPAKPLVYVGIHGSVLALDRATGSIVWSTNLKGSGFVNICLDDDRLLATTRGEVFCINAADGALLWSNKLSGLGMGLATLVTANSPETSISGMEEIRRREAAAHAASAAS